MEDKVNKMKNWRNSFLIGAILSTTLFGAGTQPGFEHQVPESVTVGQPLILSAKPDRPVEWVNLFYRSQNADDFDALVAARDGQGYYSVQIDTETVGAGIIEYYWAYKVSDQVRYAPESIADQLYRISVTANPSAETAAADRPVKEKAKTPFPLHLDASVQTHFDKAGAGTNQPDPGHSDNLSLDYRMQNGDFTIGLHSRASYTNLLDSAQTEFDLPDLALSMAMQSHALNLGDIMPAESEFSIGGSGRRGLEYRFDNQRLYLHLFTGSTQQPLGFKGLGIPKSQAMLFGGAAGLTLFKSVSVKGIYLWGKDDPGLAGNVGFAGFYATPRKGSVMAIVAESSLWRKRLTISGEFARSRYDADSGDDDEDKQDDAYRLRANLQLGFLDLQAGYRRIGRYYNSIAQAYFTNDRQGFEFGAGVQINSLRLNGSLAFEKTNTDDDPTQISAEDTRRSLSLNWQFARNSNLRFGYSANRQNAEQNYNPILSGDLDSEGFQAGIGLALNEQFTISLDGRYDRLISMENPQVEGNTMGLNLGLMWQKPDRLMINALCGINRTRNTASGSDALLVLAYVNGDLTIIPRLLSLNLNGSYNRYDTGTTAPISDSFGIDGGICLHLQRLIRIGDIIISLRGSHTSAAMGTETVSNSRIFLRSDISL